jgi:hypothetical protein
VQKIISFFFLQIIEAEAAVQQVRFTKDKKALVFDVTSDYDDIILEKWFNTKSLEMKVCTELPELEEEAGRSNGYERNGGGRSGGGRFGNGGGGGGRFGGGGGGRGGNRGRNGGGGGGGRFNNNNSFGGGDQSNKRKFDQASASMGTSKKIKFED